MAAAAEFWLRMVRVRGGGGESNGQRANEKTGRGARKVEWNLFRRAAASTPRTGILAWWSHAARSHTKNQHRLALASKYL